MRRTMLHLLVMTLLSAAAGCDTRDPMAVQPRHDPYDESAFFANGTSARPLPPGTVARGQLRTDDHRYQGLVNGKEADTFPFPIQRSDVERGKKVFEIHCIYCHGRLGDGNGMIVQRGFTHPPSFHEQRLLDAPPGHFYRVITDGYGAMYSQNDKIEPDDRWRVAAYVRALQLSQNAKLDDVPAEHRQAIESSGPR